MEALPAMPIIAPTFRTSEYNYDDEFKLSVKEYIILHFQGDPHGYNDAFSDMNKMKAAANAPYPDVECACQLKRYYGQLCMIEKRFPMARGQQLSAPFSWYDSCNDSKPITCDDVQFEKASVMFNIGAVHARIAANETRQDENSIKLAFMHFQNAAYPFDELMKMDEQFYPAADFEPDVLMFYQKAMLAQAQECLVQKSLLDHRTPVVVAKLAMYVSNMFGECATLAESFTSNFAERGQKLYAKTCRVKCDVYAAMAYVQLGTQAETDSKMGHRLAYYTRALDYMQRIHKALKNDKRPDLAPTITFLDDIVVAKQTNAKKENDFIYHEKVPNEAELMETLKNGQEGAMCKVKPLQFDPLDISICGEDIFSSLLPQTVIKSVSIYEEAKAEYRQKIMNVVDEADKSLELFLERAHYSNLQFMLDGTKDLERFFTLPDILLERNAALTAKPDAIPHLFDDLREVTQLAQAAESKLTALMARIKAIDIPHLTNDEGYIAISKELDRLHDHYTHAKSNNTALHKAMAAHSTNLHLLALPYQELRQKLMPDAAKSMTTSPETEALVKVMGKIEEMRQQRAKLVDRLGAELQADDIAKKLLAEKDFTHEETFQKELHKHDETVEYIKANVRAQEFIVHAFTEANADFCDDRNRLQHVLDEFGEKIMVLVAAYDIYNDVTAKVVEGHKFYTQLIQRCEKLDVAVNAIDNAFKAEQDKRNREKREVEQRMETARRERETRFALADFAVAGGAPTQFGAPMPMTNPNADFRLENMPPGPGAMPFQPPTSSNPGHPRLKDFMDQYRNRKAYPNNSSIPPAAFNPSPISVVQPPMNPPMPQQAPSPAPSSIHEYQLSPDGGQNGSFPPQPAPAAFQPHSVRQSNLPTQNFLPQHYVLPTTPNPHPMYVQQHMPSFLPSQVAQPYVPPQQQTSYTEMPAMNPHTPHQTPFEPPRPQQQIQQYQWETQRHVKLPATMPQNEAGGSFHPMNNTQDMLARNHLPPTPMQWSGGQPAAVPNGSMPEAVRPPYQPVQQMQHNGLHMNITVTPMPQPTPPMPLNSQMATPAVPKVSPVPTASVTPNPTMTLQSQMVTASHQEWNALKTAPGNAPGIPVQNGQSPWHIGAKESPWHKNPAQLGSQTSHAPFSGADGPAYQYNQMQPASAPGQVLNQIPMSTNAHQQFQNLVAPSQNSFGAAQSNVDLLSSLLGDLNLPPALQPTDTRPKQHLQNMQQSADVPPQKQPVAPTSTSSLTDLLGVRPAAAVQPIVHSSVATSPLNQPSILSMNSATSVTFSPYPPVHQQCEARGKVLRLEQVTDPGQFELGPCDVQRLEKRQLHASIRGDGPAPALNRDDPLNQIDAFSMSPKRP